MKLWRWFYRRIDKHEIQGKRLPAWFGVAWMDYDYQQVVLLPIPLNVVVHYARAGIRALHWFCCGRGWKKEREYRIRCEAYGQGCRDGSAAEAREVARMVLHELPAERRLLGSMLLRAELADLLDTEPIVAAVVSAGRDGVRPERDLLLLMVREMAKQTARYRELLKRHNESSLPIAFQLVDRATGEST